MTRDADGDVKPMDAIKAALHRIQRGHIDTKIEEGFLVKHIATADVMTDVFVRAGRSGRYAITRTSMPPTATSRSTAILQLVSAALREKEIPAMAVFVDERLAAFEQSAKRSMIDLVKWVTLLIPEASENRTPEYQMRNFIHQNYGRKIERDDVARAVHMNPEYASRIFKAKTGMSLRRYLNEYRIGKAKELLLDPSLLISEIVLRVGCEQFSCFSTIFRRQEGVSPKEYRRGQRGARDGKGGSPQ